MSWDCSTWNLFSNFRGDSAQFLLQLQFISIWQYIVTGKPEAENGESSNEEESDEDSDMEELDKEIATLKSEEKKADRRKKKIALKEKRKTAQRIDLKMIIPGTIRVIDPLFNIQCSEGALKLFLKQNRHLVWKFLFFQITVTFCFITLKEGFQLIFYIE